MASRALRSRNPLSTRTNTAGNVDVENENVFRTKGQGNALGTKPSTFGVRQRTALGDIKNQKLGPAHDAAKPVKPTLKAPLSTRPTLRATRSSTASTNSNATCSKNDAENQEPRRQMPLRRAATTRSTTSLQQVNKVQQPAAVRRQTSAQPDEVTKPSLPKRSNSLRVAGAPKDVTPSEVGNDGDQLEFMTDDKTVELRAHEYASQMIHDIDECDQYDPFMVAEYATDIYNYMRHLEQVQSIPADYMRTSSTITFKMRAILIDWLSQVHTRFHLLPETMYLTVAMVDRFIAAQPNVVKDQLQLIGITCMFIASKYEEIYAPEPDDFVYISDHTYTKDQLFKMEETVLFVLKYALGRPLAINFLRRFSKANSSSHDTHQLAKYLLEVQMTDYALCHVAPSLQAAASLRLAQILKADVFDSTHWTATLQYHSKYTDDDLKPILLLVCKHLLKVHSKHNKQTAVRGKYETQKFGRVAQADYLQLVNMKKVHDLIERS